ncbi:hypothetical protein GWI33_007787 [Rhynchophorus ferrugineus]|uniref:Uncharacterized protein n=1 Tax=Rhynchophorus ferrugineus TaxID=354439 RepID=A0A834ISD9_RHYFE|nr:hypothetical protein GWI33_007787 [Rhynchophorus ferrugineus]
MKTTRHQSIPKDNAAGQTSDVICRRWRGDDDVCALATGAALLGPCELQDPVWAKMNALTGIKQKRKKADNKPQTQM